MKITYDSQTIDFFNFDIPGKIIISLSGGLDSASAFFLICTHFPQIEIIPYNARDVNAPLDAIAAANIVKWMQKTFPNVVIHDLEIHNFNDRDESFVSNAACDEAVKTVPRYKHFNRIQVSKVLQLNATASLLRNTYPNTMVLDGMTLNPPINQMDELGFSHLAERRRNRSESGEIIPQRGAHIYRPYANVDKKFIADIYFKHNLMDSLFPLTRSCIGTADITDNFTRECNTCFWCYEKKWAFNL